MIHFAYFDYLTRMLIISIKYIFRQISWKQI